MKCSKCNHKNPDDAIFCNQCANELNPNQDRVRCNKCYRYSDAKLTKCPFCGSNDLEKVVPQNSVEGLIEGMKNNPDLRF